MKVDEEMQKERRDIVRSGTRRECVKMLTRRGQKAAHHVLKECSQVKVIQGLQGGLPHPGEAGTSLHPFDRSQKGG